MAALAWALVGLRTECGTSLTQMAKTAHFDKGTLSRVTNGKTLPTQTHLQGYVRACDVDETPWMALLELAQTAVRRGDGEALQAFADALTQQCAAELPQYSSALVSAQSLVAAWSHRPADGATPPEPPEADGGPSGEGQQESPSSIPEAPTVQKQQLRRFSRRTVLTGGIACVALLAGVGIWRAQDHAGTDDAHPSRSASPSVGPSPSSTPNNNSLKRFKAAQNGGPWIVGVKREQKGLSEKKNGRWVGIEIDYVKVILDTLGIKNYKFKDAGTDRRPFNLADGSVDMIVGTYGISEERESGKKGKGAYPPVLFAGPYFETFQGILVQPSPNSDRAQIHGNPETVTGLSDLVATKARICVVSGSTAEKYVAENPDKLKGAVIEKPRTDYKSCVDGLDDNYDAVLTDAPILQGFKDADPGGLKLVEDDFGHTERYGIAVKKSNEDLRDEICKAMKETEKERDEIYGKLVSKEVGSMPEKMDRCN